MALLGLLNWITGTTSAISVALTMGPRATLRLVIDALYYLVFAAMLVRVVGSWFGAFRYSRWMRPAYLLTDWLVEPIRRLLPPMGGIDWSPLVALLALWLLEQLLLGVVGY